MTKQSFTPGPWNCYEDKLTFYVDGPGIYPQVAEVNKYNPQGLANARLIAAAPELLEALEQISQHAFDDNTPLKDLEADFESMRSIALAAIAKAEGLSKLSEANITRAEGKGE